MNNWYSLFCPLWNLNTHSLCELNSRTYSLQVCVSKIKETCFFTVKWFPLCMDNWYINCFVICVFILLLCGEKYSKNIFNAGACVWKWRARFPRLAALHFARLDTLIILSSVALALSPLPMKCKNVYIFFSYFVFVIDNHFQRGQSRGFAWPWYTSWPFWHFPKLLDEENTLRTCFISFYAYSLKVNIIASTLEQDRT